MCGPTLYSRRRDFQDFFPSTFPVTMTSFDASLGYKNSSKRNLSRNGHGYIFLEVLWRRLAFYS
jgi:hypothetical protein